MTTNDDILAALDGAPAPAKLAREDALMAAAWGTEAESKHALAVWAAHEAAAAATKTLAEAIMRADGSKGIYVAESEARQLAAEAYDLAAKTITEEAQRQESVARYVGKLAERIARPRVRESKPPAAKGLTKKISRVSPNHTIVSYQ